MVQVTRAADADFLPLARWMRGQCVAAADYPAFIAKDSEDNIVGFLVACVHDGTGVVLQSVGPDHVQAALFLELRASFPMKRLVVLTDNAWVCHELRQSASTRHLAQDPCVIVGDFVLATSHNIIGDAINGR